MIKTARVYTLDELKEKCQKALANPKLIEIVKTAPLNKDGKVNTSWVYGQAENYVHEQTKDLRKTKELAVAARFLAMLRRDFKEEFEKLILPLPLKPEVELTEPKKRFYEIEFEIPKPLGYARAELITRETGGNHYVNEKKFTIRFCSIVEGLDSARPLARSFCIKILNALFETADPPGDLELMDSLIQLLEEKFGLKVEGKEN
ncbi:MAG: hypothetical protein HYT20_01225 [Candidatus Nealsonbacteria bacterium]|nr:hypothetical protein [Candidatus Nealsonbacteria bacterium]